METSGSLKDSFARKTIKREPDDTSTSFAEIRENLDPQKYYYKEELDLKWDETDNYDENCATFVEEPVNKSRDFPNKDSILQDKNPLPKKVNCKTENPDTSISEIPEHADSEKYHYKEELNLDWDEKDNNYAETSIEKPIESSITDETEQNKSTSVVQNNDTRSKKKNVTMEDPDTEKDCPKCKKRLKNSNTLRKHSFYCGKEPHLQCDSCSYKAKYKNALIEHIMKNHPQQIHKWKKKKMGRKNTTILKEQELSDKCFRFCTNCNVSMNEPTLHKCIKCDSWLMYQCRKCDAKFPTRDKLIRHIIDSCDPKGYYHCPACDFKATRKKYVKVHFNRHKVSGSQLDNEDIKWKKIEGKDDTALLFTCPSCGKQYQRKASLASHMRFCIKSQGVSKPPRRHVKKDPGFKIMMSKFCAICTKTEKVQSMKTQSSECCGEMMLFKCLNCTQGFELHSSLYKHVRNKCVKMKCNMCDYEGSTRNISYHKRRMHDPNSVECRECNAKLKNQTALSDHLLYYHWKGTVQV